MIRCARRVARGLRPALLWYNPSGRQPRTPWSGCRSEWSGSTEGEARIVARRRKYTRSEKTFYILSLLIVASMVIGLFAVALNPG